jgi:hypothetical protein
MPSAFHKSITLLRLTLCSILFGLLILAISTDDKHTRIWITLVSISILLVLCESIVNTHGVLNSTMYYWQCCFLPRQPAWYVRNPHLRTPNLGSYSLQNSGQEYEDYRLFPEYAEHTEDVEQKEEKEEFKE